MAEAHGPLPEPLPVIGTSPCTEHACRACCFETRMPLLERDMERLEAATRKPRTAFSVHDGSGPPRLRNEGGQCVFLDEDGCSVYAHRPAGCRMYPLVLDPERDQGVLDDECPHTRRFRIRPHDRAALAELVAALGLD